MFKNKMVALTEDGMELAQIRAKWLVIHGRATEFLDDDPKFDGFPSLEGMRLGLRTVHPSELVKDPETKNYCKNDDPRYYGVVIQF